MVNKVTKEQYCSLSETIKNLWTFPIELFKGETDIANPLFKKPNV